MREGWTYKKLGECFPFIKNGANIKQIKDADGLPITRIETLSGGVFNRDRMGYASIYDSSKYSDYILEDGDLLMSHINSKTYIGRTVEYKKEGNEVLIHGMNLLRLKADRTLILPSFMAYYTNSSIFKSDVARIRKDAVNQSSMAIGDLRKFEIPLPPKSQQEAIVSELDEINSLLALKREQLQKYDKLAQSLFYEMFGDPVENEKGWVAKKLGELCTIERGGSPRPIKDYITDEEDGLNWIKIGDATEGSIYIQSTKEKIRKEGLKKTRMVFKGDFILSNSMSFGKPYILGIDGCIHDGWLVIHDDKGCFDKIYLYHSLAHPSMYSQFKNMAVGGVVNNLNSEMVRKVSVLVPPLPLQQQFASRIEQIESQKQQVQAAIEKLETLLASRMQYWFE